MVSLVIKHTFWNCLDSGRRWRQGCNDSSYPIRSRSERKGPRRKDCADDFRSQQPRWNGRGPPRSECRYRNHKWGGLPIFFHIWSVVVWDFLHITYGLIGLEYIYRDSVKYMWYKLGVIEIHLIIKCILLNSFVWNCFAVWQNRLRHGHRGWEKGPLLCCIHHIRSFFVLRLYC